MNNTLLKKECPASSIAIEEDDNTVSYTIPTKHSALCYTLYDPFAFIYPEDDNGEESKLAYVKKNSYVPNGFIAFIHNNGISIQEDCFKLDTVSQKLLQFDVSYNSGIVNYAEYGITDKLRIGLQAIIKKIYGFKDLKSGWDTYQAKVINVKTIVNAIDIISKIISSINLNDIINIPIPFVAPLSNGGILFEWSTLYREIEFSIPEKSNKPFQYLITVKHPFYEKEDEVYSSEELVNIVINWLYNKNEKKEYITYS